MPGQPGLLVIAAVTVCAAYLALWLWPDRLVTYPDYMATAGALFMAVVGCAGVLKFLLEGQRRAGDLILFIRAVRGDDTRGSAGWLTERQARRAGLHRRKAGSRLVGVLGRSPLWLWTEVHQLVIGPAGSSKSAACIITMLCAVAESCLVNDTKGELYEVTAVFRRKKFGQRIVKLDPRDPHSACVNPLDLVFFYLVQDSPEVLTLARGIALQLHPEPPQEGQNKFFRIGTRRKITIVIIVVVVVCPPEERNLATVYRALSDESLLHALLTEAAQSTRLNGEVAAMAEDMHQMAFGDEGAARTYEQFRIGAIQALEAFGPGGYLARITSKTTFSFADLKTQKVTCYLIIDHNNKETLGRWSALNQWLAAYEMVSIRDNRPVHMVLDEFCNAPLHGLPDILTLLRSYGIKVTMATQDLSDITRVYGKQALETIISETDIKQFLGGIRSQTTLDFLTKYMGEFTEHAPSCSFQGDTVRESLGRAGRALKTADEVRRLDTDQQIVVFRNLKPILCRKTQVFSIDPWRTEIGINSMYGKKRYLKPVEVVVTVFGSRVTRRGRSATPRRNGGWRIAGYLLRGLLPGPAALLVVALVLAVWQIGVPHVRVSYGYSGSWSSQWCDYWGPHPFTTYGGDCPVIVFRDAF